MEAFAFDLAGLQPEDFAFQAPNGGPVRLQSWRRRFFEPAVRAAGLDHLTPHDLRHTAVTFGIAGGASANEIARRAGHASVVTVLNRYGHLLPGTEEKVTDSLDAMRLAGRASALTGGLLVHVNGPGSEAHGLDTAWPSNPSSERSA